MSRAPFTGSTSKIQGALRTHLYALRGLPAVSLLAATAVGMRPCMLSGCAGAHLSVILYVCMVMKTIADVIDELQAILQECTRTQNPAGYFATLYLQMTRAVKNGIDTGQFQDAARMEKLDVIFASRYIQAYRQYQSGAACTASWQAAFTAASNHKHAVIQHILGGINAHINLDLGIAAAQTSPGQQIHDLAADFEQINVVIGSLAAQFQEKLNTISVPMRLLDTIGGNGDEAVLNFSIGIARKAAWKVALDMANMPEPAHAEYIDKIDTRTKMLAAKIYNPGILLSGFMRIIRLFEPTPVSAVLQKLA